MDLMKHLISNEPTDESQIKRTRHKHFECYKYQRNYVVKLEDGTFYPVLGSPDTYQVTTYKEHPFTSLMDAMLWVVRQSNDNISSFEFV